VFQVLSALPAMILASAAAFCAGLLGNEVLVG
jgi:hypothetical protein